MDKLVLLLLVALAFGFVKTEPEPLFRSPRKFYRPGDTIEVVLERDTTLDVGFCTLQKKAVVFYAIEKFENGVWTKVENTRSLCQANFPSTMKIRKGFSIKHFLLDEGTFRVVISGEYRSTEFELR